VKETIMNIKHNIKPTFGHAGRGGMLGKNRVLLSQLDTLQLPANHVSGTPWRKALAHVSTTLDYNVQAANPGLSR